MLSSTFIFENFIFDRFQTACATCMKVNADCGYFNPHCLQVHTTLSHEGDKKYPGWLENFRQEMMTCVTSLDTPMPVPPVNTPSSGHSHPSCPTPSTAGPSRDENEEVDVGKFLDANLVGTAISSIIKIVIS